MPKRGLISLIFTIAGLRLIIGYMPPAQAGIGGISPDPSVTPDPSASPTIDPTPTTTVHDGTYTGNNFNYNYGFMKVTVTISGGKVTAASAVQSGKNKIGYQSRACTEAVFNSAAIDLAATSSAGNDFVSLKPNACSGASYSWWGYANSLQAAVDKARY